MTPTTPGDRETGPSGASSGPRIVSGLFALALVVATGVIALTAEQLPAHVASHFNAAGRPDAFMDRSRYLLLMFASSVGVPLLAALAVRAVLRHPEVSLNLPHAPYWSTPERRPRTVAWLNAHFDCFAALLTVFFVYVHQVVVFAHRASPPRMSTAAFLTGMALFLLCIGVWVVALVRRFQLPEPVGRGVMAPGAGGAGPVTQGPMAQAPGFQVVAAPVTIMPRPVGPVPVEVASVHACEPGAIEADMTEADMTEAAMTEPAMTGPAMTGPAAVEPETVEPEGSKQESSDTEITDAGPTDAATCGPERDLPAASDPSPPPGDPSPRESTPG